MKPIKFVLITISIIAYFFAARFIGWMYFSQTKLWDRIINDNFHHWQVGVVVIIFALLFLRKKPELRDWALALSAGMVIDEWMYFFSPMNPRLFTHYHPVGMMMEFVALAIFCYLVMKFKRNR